LSRWTPKWLSGSSLGFRLGSTLVLALLPLGVLSMVQASRTQQDLDASLLEGVAGASLSATRPQIDLIRDAQVAARTWASSLTHSLDEGASCIARARSVAATIPEASLVAFIPLSGQMRCSSTGVESDFAGNPLFEQMIARPEPVALYNPMGPVSNTAIVGLSHPVFDPSGTQVGIAGISLPYYALTPADFQQTVANWGPEFLATVTRDGTVLISSAPDITLAAALPKGITVDALPGRAGRATFETDESGRHILSVTEVAKDLFLVSVWQSASAGFIGPFSAAAPFLLPGLTWIAALAVAGLASSRLVVRHVRALSRSIADFLRDRTRVIVPDVTDAPAEIQSLHQAYAALVRTIEQEEAELQNLIVDKDALLREVNHRSGNSLQIIASVMRMYRREAQEPAVRGVLDGMINRVIALSSTHTSLYDLSGQRDVPLDAVVANVVRRLKEIHRIPLGTTERRLESVRTDAKTAVGVAMAAAEAVGALFTVQGLAAGQVGVTLEDKTDRIVLQISGPAVPEFQDGTDKGIPSVPRRMLQQYAIQLDGTLQIETSGGRSMVTIDFPNPAAIT
jgi:two-component system, sensor histidine kinase PdtaS